MSDKYQAMMIGNHTYGFLNLKSNIFRCTHGGWEAELSFLPGNQCKLQGVGIFSYEYLDEIPEDYNYC
jgi:hypothetical protein